jgi:hypothetical protein
VCQVAGSLNVGSNSAARCKSASEALFDCALVYRDRVAAQCVECSMRANVELSASQLIYETGFAYMRKRDTILLKNISSVSAAAIAPTVTVKTTDGQELKISVGSGCERDKFYAVLQSAVGR